MKKALLVALIALVAWLTYEWLTFPDVARLGEQPPETTSFMERRKKELRRQGKSDELSVQWIPYDRISPYLRRAVLVSEDSAFYEHEGLDVEAMKEALRRDWEERRFSRGGSTITQQLAKNLYLSPSRSPLRKLKEILIAQKLEKNLSKKRILEIYLNVVEFGERVYGVEAASKHYFGKPAAALTPSQSALLAGCLPNPRVMSPGAPNQRLRARQRIILSRMRRWGYLAERQVEMVKVPPPREVPEPVTDTTVPVEPEQAPPTAEEINEQPAAPPETTTTESVPEPVPVEPPIETATPPG